MFGVDRQDQVLCVSSSCHDANDGIYEVLDANDSVAVSACHGLSLGGASEVTAGPPLCVLFSPLCFVQLLFAAGDSIEIDGQAYPVVPLNLFFSYTHNDNFVATNASAPDATYLISFNDGLVLSVQAPGTIPLQVGAPLAPPSHTYTYPHRTHHTHNNTYTYSHTYPQRTHHTTAIPTASHAHAHPSPCGAAA
jgi:hypothetical protein